MRFGPVVPGYDLNKLRLKGQDLTPTVEPQVITTPEPVLPIVRDVCEEPGRDSHHVWLALQGTDVSVITVGVHVGRSVRPCLPGEQTVCDTTTSRRSGRSTYRCPVGHEEASCLGFDVVPVVRLVGTFECGCYGFAVVLHVCRARFVFVHVAYHSILSPGAVSSIVEAEEKLEAHATSDRERIRKLLIRRTIRIARNIQCKPINPRLLRRLYIQLPLRRRVRITITHHEVSHNSFRINVGYSKEHSRRHD